MESINDVSKVVNYEKDLKPEVGTKGWTKWLLLFFYLNNTYIVSAVAICFAPASIAIA